MNSYSLLALFPALLGVCAVALYLFLRACARAAAHDHDAERDAGVNPWDTVVCRRCKAVVMEGGPNVRESLALCPHCAIAETQISSTTKSRNPSTLSSLTS